VAGLIGDDTAEIVASLRLPSRVRVVAIDGGAFAMHGQAAIVDRFTGILLDAAPLRARKTPRAVGLVGFPPDDGEAKRLLARAGLALRAWPQLDSAQAEWNALAGVSLAVVSDARLFGRLGRILGERHRVPVVELVPPLGAAATERWLGGIAAGFGLERRMAAACSAERSVARRAVAAFRRRHGGKRLAVHVGGRKDFALPTLVRGGLSAVPAFAELGLRVELLFQGAVEEAQQRRIETLLAHHGLDVPYRCLPDRLSLTRALRAGRFAAVYCSDSLHEEVGAAGVPLVPVGSLRPGFAGCVANGAWLGARLR
jgi:nitrogenase molybdenum-iron protein alpha/beta subunit